MRRILIIILLIVLSVTLLLVGSSISIAGGPPVRVLVRQIGTSTYFYNVANLCTKPITKLKIGYNRYKKGSEEELSMAPLAIESPVGWEGNPIFLEESNYLHISWKTIDPEDLISPGAFLDGFIVHMPQSYDLMKQATFTVLYNDGTWISGKVEIDTSPPILFDGKGQRPLDVNTFLAYLRPIEAQTTLQQGQSAYYLLIFYGKTILPETFKSTLNGIDITGSFHPKADTSEAVKLNLQKGRNTLILSVDGIRDDGKKATDTDRLIFIVP